MRKRRREVGGVIAALTAAVAVFIVMLQLEQGMLEAYEKGVVYVAAAEIPKGKVMGEEDLKKYFRKVEMDCSLITESTLCNSEQLLGLSPKIDIEQGVVLSKGMFETINDVLADMEEPVIAGFKADDLYQVAGGVLRAGDRIHIYSISENNETMLIEDEVYIQSVFGQTGVQISNEDRETSAQRINIYLEKKDVEAFYSELKTGNLRVVKMLKR